MEWDPAQYQRYEDERGRPFLDLLGRVRAQAPRRVVDLGCGPGTTTALLAERWPSALVEGLDSSAEMIAVASSPAPPHPGLRFRVESAEAWAMPADCDVLISNATLHWVPTHRSLLAAWAQQLPLGGWLAFQVPANFDAPSHVLMRSLAASSRYPGAAGLLDVDAVDSAADYAVQLQAHGLVVDAWETTYVHVLTGLDPVLEWVRGTGLRPVLAALSDEDGRAFSSELAELLRAAYPPAADGTTQFPFRRVFVVGRKPG